MMIVMSVCTVLFVGLAARWVANAAGFGGLFSSAALDRPETFGVRPLMLGAAIATLSYIGFDAVSTLAEDTLHPERDIAFATVIVCVLQTIFCVVTVYLAALVWPDYRGFPETETAILDIGRRIGGPVDGRLPDFRAAGCWSGQRAHGTGRGFASAVRHGARRRNPPAF